MLVSVEGCWYVCISGGMLICLYLWRDVDMFVSVEGC